jgi:hypothetical protein
MSTSPLEQHRESFDELVAAGCDPAAAGCTYEWHCTKCDTRNYTGAPGGEIPGACEPHCSPEHIHIHAMLAGERWSMGTVGDLARDDPGA